MDKMPKRRKYKDNPYELNKNSITNKYYIKFKDSTKKEQFVEVDATIYKVFDGSELSDISEMNEYDNHIEHSEIYEYKIDLINSRKIKSTEELVEAKMLHVDLKNAIQHLSEIKKRRIQMYYFDGLTQQENLNTYCEFVVDNILSGDDIDRIKNLCENKFHVEISNDNEKTIISIHRIVSY